MPMYRVTVDALVIATKTVEVRAANAEDALSMARRAALGVSGGWSCDDVQIIEREDLCDPEGDDVSEVF